MHFDFFDEFSSSLPALAICAVRCLALTMCDRPSRELLLVAALSLSLLPSWLIKNI